MLSNSDVSAVCMFLKIYPLFGLLWYLPCVFQLITTNAESSTIKDLVSVQKHFSLVFTPNGVDRDALQRTIEDHQQHAKPSSELCQSLEVLDFSSCMQNNQITIPTLNG